MNYFIMASGFMAQMHAPLDICRHSSWLRFVWQRLLNILPPYFLSMIISILVGDAWFQAGTASSTFLVLCLTSVRWYLPWMQFDGSNFCPNTVSWSVGTLLLWWSLLPPLQLLLLRLELKFGQSLTLTVCTALIVTALQPSQWPYAFPLPYGPPFICGVLAARQVKCGLLCRPCPSAVTCLRWSTTYAPAICADGCVAMIFVILTLRDHLWFRLHVEARNFSIPLLAVFICINAHSGASGLTALFLQLPSVRTLSHCTLEIFLFQAPVHRLLTRSVNLPDWFSRWRPEGRQPEKTLPFVTFALCLCWTSSTYARRKPFAQLVTFLSGLSTRCSIK